MRSCGRGDGNGHGACGNYKDNTLSFILFSAPSGMNCQYSVRIGLVYCNIGSLVIKSIIDYIHYQKKVKNMVDGF